MITRQKMEARKRRRHEKKAERREEALEWLATHGAPKGFDDVKELARGLGRPAETLIALTANNDPFYVGPTRQAHGEWFTKLWFKFKKQNKTSHIRRLHYVMISQKTAVLMPDSRKYINTSLCWTVLKNASLSARYLGLVDADDVVDRRNRNAATNIRDTGLPLLYVGGDELTMGDMPEPPRAELEVRERTQRYQIEIWCEKSTMDDVLEPFGRYGVHLQTGTGDISLTRCLDCIKRAQLDGRPLRILYISDFDKSGDGMPVAVARKIEFELRRLGGDDLDIQVRPIALTYEQCQEYQLPRTPAKETDRRTASFVERFGEGVTELDALEALHPGVLAQLIQTEIDRYYDHDLDPDTEQEAEPIEAELETVTKKVHRKHAKDLASLRKEYAAIKAAHAKWAKRATPIWAAMADEIEADAEPIVDAVDWPDPALGDEDPDPLFDSTRDYVEQIDRYKRHQDKPTERQTTKLDE